MDLHVAIANCNTLCQLTLYKSKFHTVNPVDTVGLWGL